MGIQRRKLMKQSDSILIGFSHTDNSSTANRNACFPHVLQRPQPVLVVARRNNLAIKLGGCVEVMVVSVESCLSQAMGLRLVQHPESATNFQSKRGHAADHAQNGIEFRAIAYLAPCGSHAKS